MYVASVQVPPRLQAYTRAGTMTRPVAGRKCERRTERNGVKREICRGRAEVCRNLDMRLRIHYQILVQRVAQRRLRLGYLANETTQQTRLLIMAPTVHVQPKSPDPCLPPPRPTPHVPRPAVAASSSTSSALRFRSKKHAERPPYLSHPPNPTPLGHTGTKGLVC